jgi:uncharacterized membrane protein
LSSTVSRPDSGRAGVPWLALALLGYPVLVQFAVSSGEPAFAFGAICLLLLILGMAFLKRSQWLGWLAVAALGAFAHAVCFSGNGRYLLFLPPVLFSLTLMAFFGRTLRPGSEPLITRISRSMRGEALPAEVERYTRRVTILWVAMFGLLATEATLLAAFAPLWIWSLFTNFINHVLVVLLLAGEYLYHSRRYPNKVHHNIGDFARDLVRVDLKRLLDD